TRAHARARRRPPPVPWRARRGGRRRDHGPRSRCGRRLARLRRDRSGKHGVRVPAARGQGSATSGARTCVRQEACMLPDLNRVIEQVSKEKGIDRQIIVEALKDAMLSAAKRTYGPEKRIEAQWNSEIGEVELFEIRTVVDQVADSENEVTLAEARRSMDPE